MSKLSAIGLVFLTTALVPAMAAAPPSTLTMTPMAKFRALAAESPTLARHIKAGILTGSAFLKAQKKARQGDMKAEFDLGRSYLDMAILHKRGSQKNSALGARWYRQAATQGYAPAQARLAGAYLSGVGVPQNTTMALAWLHRAAAQKYAPAEGELGNLYLVGQYVSANTHKGLRLIREAARRGDAASEMGLGFMYATGGAYVPKNYAKAARWLLMAKASSKKMGIALPIVTDMLGVAEAHLSPAQISQVQQEARKDQAAQSLYKTSTPGTRHR